MITPTTGVLGRRAAPIARSAGRRAPARTEDRHRHRHRHRLHGDDGSSLMLMPVAVLIVLLLGAIAFDLSVVHLAHRDLLDVAESAANDAATEALDQVALRRDGAYRIDPRLAARSLDRSLVRHRVDQAVTARAIVVGPAGDQVTVELERPVPYVFAKSLPGEHGTTVRARATAVVHRR